MAIRDYTARILDKRSKQPSFDSLSYVPIAIPAGSKLPETTQQTMARMMLSSGMISVDDYQKMIGVIFDGDYGVEDEDFGDFGDDGTDRFRQSSFAEYEDYSDYNQEVRLDTKEGGAAAISNDSSAPVEPGTPSNVGVGSEADASVSAQNDTK